MRHDHHSWGQSEFPGPPGEPALIKRCDAVAGPAARVVQRINDIDARFAVGEGLLDCITVFEDDAWLFEKTPDHRRQRIAPAPDLAEPAAWRAGSRTPGLDFDVVADQQKLDAASLPNAELLPRLLRKDDLPLLVTDVTSTIPPNIASNANKIELLL